MLVWPQSHLYILGLGVTSKERDVRAMPYIHPDLSSSTPKKRKEVWCTTNIVCALLRRRPAAESVLAESAHANAKQGSNQDRLAETEPRPCRGG